MQPRDLHGSPSIRPQFIVADAAITNAAKSRIYWMCIEETWGIQGREIIRTVKRQTVDQANAPPSKILGDELAAVTEQEVTASSPQSII